MKRGVIVLFIAAALIGGWAAIGSATQRGPLARAATIVKQGCDRGYLARETVFFQLEGEKNIDAWFGFFFSALNTSNWVWESEEDAEFMRGPVVPAGLVMLPCQDSDTPASLLESDIKAQWNREQRYQLLVSIDPERSTVTVRGFENWEDEPQLTQEWPFPDLE